MTIVVMLFPFIITTTLAAENRELEAQKEQAHRDEQAKRAEIKCDVRLKESILIRAKPSSVKSTIDEQRTNYRELEYARLLSREGPTTIIEQRFKVALIGTASCTFSDTEISTNQIDYRLLKSDMFAVMDGRWVMTPTADSQFTKLDLYCQVSLIKKVPGFLLRLGLSRSLRRHLEAIKKSAESRLPK